MRKIPNFAATVYAGRGWIERVVEKESGVVGSRWMKCVRKDNMTPAMILQ